MTNNNVTKNTACSSVKLPLSKQKLSSKTAHYALESKVIWLIGASAGIGAALAKELSSMGHELVLSARDEAALYRLKEQLPNNSHVAALDVTKSKDITAAYSTIPRPDMVIYNAGAYQPCSAINAKLKSSLQMVDVNLQGAFRVLDVVLPDMLADNAGHIALVASIAGVRGLPNAWGYGASKAALIHLAENLALDVADTNMKVQVINPGFVKTRLTDKNDFKMPALLEPEQAACYMAKGLFSKKFEIHFPKRFTLFLKLLGILPHVLYKVLAKKLKN